MSAPRLTRKKSEKERRSPIASATRISSDEIGLQQQIEFRRALLRCGEITRENGQGGWSVLGKLIELRYERTSDHAEIPERLRALFAAKGNVLDWGDAKSAPLVGTDRARSILLMVSAAPPLPEQIDPRFKPQEFVELDGNRIPLLCVPPHYRDRLANRDGTRVRGREQKITQPEKISARFVDHACGAMGPFLVVRPLTEGWIQLAGVKALQKVVFEPRGEEYPGLYLDPQTGEGHFLGGHCDFERRVG